MTTFGISIDLNCVVVSYLTCKSFPFTSGWSSFSCQS